MEAKFARLRSNFILIMVSIGLVLGGQAWAQSTTIEFEKATLVSKFAKYVTWPDGAIKTEFVIGVYEDNAKYDYFKNFFANKGVKNKDISVRLITSFQEAKDVNILYISSNKRNLLTLADKAINGSHVLIITENSKVPNETMIDLSYDKQKSALIFNVNDANIIAEQLIFPEFSYFVDDKKNKEVLPESPSFALKKQQEEELLALKNLLALQKQIVEQKTTLSQLNKKLDLSEENSKKYSLSLQQTSEDLKTAHQENARKSEEIKAKDQQLQELEKQFKVQQEQLKMNKEDWQLAGENKAKEQEESLIELTEKLKQQKEITDQNAKKLASMTNELADVNKENKSLSSFQLLFYVFAIIAVIALVTAFIMWKKAKNIVLQPSLSSTDENASLLPIREEQLIKSENFAALGYVATDITYAVGLSLVDLQTELKSTKDDKNLAILNPVVTLLENFNTIAADQDDTEIQSFDVIAYMQKMMMLYEFEFSQSDITYHYSGEKSLMIKSVPSYIAIVLLNVINNSLKHGFDNNGNGQIALKVEKDTKNGVKITYSDDGKGMSKTTLEQVFKPFYTTRSDRGYVGVGMSTTYDIIKNKLAGEIKIDSQIGIGTTVIITLP